MAALTDRAVLIAGATSDSGRAATRTLLDAGAHVVATGRDAAKLAPLAALGAVTATLPLRGDEEEAQLPGGLVVPPAYQQHAEHRPVAVAQGQQPALPVGYPVRLPLQPETTMDHELERAAQGLIRPQRRGRSGESACGS